MRASTWSHTATHPSHSANGGQQGSECACRSVYGSPCSHTHSLPHSIYVGTAVPAIVIKGAINHYICAKQGRCFHGDPNDLHCFAYQQKSLQSWQSKGEASTETCQPASVLLSLSFPLSFSHSLLVDVQIALQQSLSQANQDGS